MNFAAFTKRIKKDRYQVFLMTSPIPLPLSFAIHVWLVTVKRGTWTRWETGNFYKPKAKKAWGYVYQGLYQNNPTTGMNIIPFSPSPRFQAKIKGYLEGKSGSQTHKLISFIERNAKNYPYQQRYGLMGPNSNTFVAWILKNASKTKLILPKNAFGKDYTGR